MRITDLAPKDAGTFVLVAPVPLEVAWHDRRFRLQVESESISGECRLPAVDLAAERGTYSAYLIAQPARESVLEAQMKGDGLKCQGRAGFALFEVLVKEGRAMAA